MLETRTGEMTLSFENPRTGIDRIFEMLQAGQQTHTGKVVTENLAFNLATVYRCVSIIANGIAMMPLAPYRRLPNGGGEIATEHYLYSLLAESANAHTTAFRFKRLMTAWAVFRGNAIALYDYHSNGRVYRLTPVHPDKVTFVPQADGSLEYDIKQPNGAKKTYTSESVFHLRGLEMQDDGIGLSVLSIARQSFGLSLAADEAGGKVFARGLITQGYLSYPGKLGPKGRENLEQSFTSKHSGLSNAHKTPVYEEGLTFVKTSIDPGDAQLLETRKFSKTEICTWFGVPPHMAGDLERSTNNNIEHQSIEFVRDSLGPYMTNWESEISHSLLSPTERKTVYVTFNSDVLLRGDLASRYKAYGQGIQNGFLMPNEARVKENMNPAKEGDRLYANGAFIPLEMAGSQYGTGNTDKTEETPTEGSTDEKGKTSI
jgi:HK97 family phage portal protein